MCSPIFGKYLDVLGSRRLFLSGAFVAGATNVAFGFLEWVDGAGLFLGLSLLIRVASAVGEAAFFSSVYPLAVQVLSHSQQMGLR